MLNTLDPKNATASIPVIADIPLCQKDYPLDNYQQAFMPYAEEYLALPDRRMSTVLSWMRDYIEPAKRHFGDELLLLSHYYMGGEIVKLINEFGGFIGDSYQLALQAVKHQNARYIVESAVHFMAETVSILAQPEQSVYITNPKAGCTMEMHAKDFMVMPALKQLNERYGVDNVLPICYMNTSGRIKAMVGAQGGAVCTSSNIKKIMQWALNQNKKILFIPDKLMGENVAAWLGIENLAYWPAGTQGAQYCLDQQKSETLAQFDKANLVLFSSFCAVHSYYTAEMVKHWQSLGYHVVAHPECDPSVVSIADSHGSTAYIWQLITQDQAGIGRYAVATEQHMVSHLCYEVAKQQKNIDIVNVGDVTMAGWPGMGCGCATMSRNDPPHLVATLDLLRQNKMPAFNLVEAGDVVNEFTGQRNRLILSEKQQLIQNARRALENMIQITES